MSALIIGFYFLGVDYWYLCFSFTLWFSE